MMIKSQTQDVKLVQKDQRTLLIIKKQISKHILFS